MGKIVSETWKNEMRAKIAQGQVIDVTSGFNPAVQWLIERLSVNGTPYKVYSLGAGVKRVTTETDTCPCCRRKL